jgi:hypothetical protein
VLPTVTAGRLPANAHEIAVGATTMHDLHTHLGGTVPLALSEHGHEEPVRVVGEVVLPGLAPYPGSDKAGLGVGALLTESGWTRYSSEYGKVVYVLRYRPGQDATTLAAQMRRVDPGDQPLGINRVTGPSGIESLQRLRSTPTLLALLVALMLGAAVANAIVVAVRRRRHDLAVLRTLGLTTSQLVRTVLWQATTVGLVAVIVGIPLGLVVGRWSWNLLVTSLGMVPAPVVPGLVVTAVAVGVLALTNLVGIVPGLRAAHAPGATLRAE